MRMPLDFPATLTGIIPATVNLANKALPMEATMSSPTTAGTKNTAASAAGYKLHYQGRKTSRAGSEQRRRNILEAALRIVVRDGVRGVRHRAVAKEAEVPLSATTYYFKDISDLITDMFTLFVEMGADKYRVFWEESRQDMQDALAALGDDNAARSRFAERMSELAANYVLHQLQNQREHLLAEQAFHLECLRNDNLRTIAFGHHEFLMNDLRAFFTRMGSDQPDIDAKLLFAIIARAEYEGLLQDSEAIDDTMILAMLKRQLQCMLRLPM